MSKGSKILKLPIQEVQPSPLKVVPAESTRGRTIDITDSPSHQNELADENEKWIGFFGNGITFFGTSVSFRHGKIKGRCIPVLTDEEKKEFDRLIIKHRRVIKSVIFHYALCESIDKSEIESLAYLYMFRYYRDYAPEKFSFSTFCYNCTNRVIGLYLKHLKTRKEKLVDSFYDHTYNDYDEEAEIKFNQEHFDDLYNCVNRAPSELRPFIDLYIQGFTKIEIAEQLTVSIPRVTAWFNQFVSWVRANAKMLFRNTPALELEQASVKKFTGLSRLEYVRNYSRERTKIRRNHRISELRSSGLSETEIDKIFTKGRQFTNEQAEAIIREILDGKSTIALADKYACSTVTINEIKSSTSYKDVGSAELRAQLKQYHSKYGGKKHTPTGRLTPQQRQEIFEAKGKVSSNVLVKKYGVTQPAISYIWKTFKTGTN